MSALLFLGEFSFSTSADALISLDRTSEARLAAQDVLGLRPPVQWGGPSAQSVTLAGVILPEYQGGMGQIEALHAATEDGLDRALVTAYGLYFGMYQIKKVQEKRLHLAFAGIPRRIDFNLELMRTAE